MERVVSSLRGQPRWVVKDSIYNFPLPIECPILHLFHSFSTIKLLDSVLCLYGLFG